MPCLAQDHHASNKLPAAGHYCKSLSSLIQETYAHCHLPCVRIPGGGGWSSGDEDSDDDSVLDEAFETKQVIMNEMRSRQMKKRSSYSADSPSPIRLSSTTAFAWSYTLLDPRTVFEKVSSPKKCVVVEDEGDGEKDEQVEEAADGGEDEYEDADDESEAFYSVKSFFTRSTSRAATVASSVGAEDPPLFRPPETWEGLRGCEGWPFGLCRRPAVLLLPPLPSTPADSWKWRKSVSGLAGSPLPAYSYYCKTPRST